MWVLTVSNLKTIAGGILKKSFCRLALTLIPLITLLGGCGGGDNVTLTGSVTTIAGMGSASSVDGTGTQAGFNSPVGMALDGTNLYVADSDNHTVRKIVIASAVVTTFAGSAGINDTSDGIGSAARFDTPNSITSDGLNFYVADTFNHTIRQIDIITGAVTTFAGIAGIPGSNDDVIGTNARFNFPFGIVWNGIDNNLYVADRSSHTIRQITLPAGEVSTLAGTAGISGSTDDFGSLARFNNPSGITTDGSNLYVTDTTNHIIRKIVLAGAGVTTIAGAVLIPGSTDAIGTSARFSSPAGITWSAGNLYIADTGNHTIRQIVVATEAVTTLAGTAGSSGSTNGTGSEAKFLSPEGITSDGTSLYVTDTGNHTIRRIQ